MIKKRRQRSKAVEPFIANNSSWVRASSSGMVRDIKRLGDHVVKGEALAELCSPTGTFVNTLTAPRSGVIIGKQNIPLVQEGDAMFHVATFEAIQAVQGMFGHGKPQQVCTCTCGFSTLTW